MLCCLYLIYVFIFKLSLGINLVAAYWETSYSFRSRYVYLVPECYFLQPPFLEWTFLSDCFIS